MGLKLSVCYRREQEEEKRYTNDGYDMMEKVVTTRLNKELWEHRERNNYGRPHKRGGAWDVAVVWLCSHIYFGRQTHKYTQCEDCLVEQRITKKSLYFFNVFKMDITYGPIRNQSFQSLSKQHISKQRCKITLSSDGPPRQYCISEVSVTF